MKFSEIVDRKIQFLKIWNSQTAQVRLRVSLARQMTIGTDSKADLKLAGLKGFEAQINFDDSKLVWLDRDATEEIESDRIFQVGPYAILWKTWQPFCNPVILKGLGLGVAAVAIVVASLFMISTEPNCSLMDRIVASGKWAAPETILSVEERIALETLSKSGRSFKEALKQGAFVRARAEVQAMRRIITQTTSGEACGSFEAVDEMDLKLSRRLIGDYLKTDDPLGAAKEWRRIQGAQHGSRLGLYERRLIAAARDRYMEGYRLEDEDTERAYELMEQAREICRTMNEGDECFRMKTGARKAESRKSPTTHSIEASRDAADVVDEESSDKT